MAASRSAGLKTLQWFLRGIQFACAAIILAIYSYFLATLHDHKLEIKTWVRAVEGIAGFAMLYIIGASVLLCYIVGRTLTSFLIMVLDFAFMVAFIYVAAVNGGGAGSCKGDVKTPFGNGDAEKDVVDDGHGGFTKLPKLGVACRLESACLGLAIIAIFFFVFSITAELYIGRNYQKEKRAGLGMEPEEPIPEGSEKKKSGGLFGWLRRRKTAATTDYNVLPEHTHPEQLDHRTTWGSPQTAQGGFNAQGTYGGHGYSRPQPTTYNSHTDYDDGTYDARTDYNNPWYRNDQGDVGTYTSYERDVPPYQR